MQHHASRCPRCPVTYTMPCACGKKSFTAYYIAYDLLDISDPMPFDPYAHTFFDMLAAMPVTFSRYAGTMKTYARVDAMRGACAKRCHGVSSKRGVQAFACLCAMLLLMLHAVGKRRCLLRVTEPFVDVALSYLISPADARKLLSPRACMRYRCARPRCTCSACYRA